jgi:Fe-S-cluster-containing dehydrogenase component
MRIVEVDPTSCVACRNCEYACAFKQTGDFDIKDSNIRVNFYPEERACIPWTCVHCGEGWCMEVCPAGAILRNPETGAVEIDANHCAGWRRSGLRQVLHLRSSPVRGRGRSVQLPPGESRQ